jgi:putative membrane-bound dehydrogenase-like protein
MLIPRAGCAADVSHLMVPEGFEVTIAAEPPLVKYPMQGAFDERGRLFLCESTGLNLNEAGLLEKTPNFIRMIEDTDGDGAFDKSTIFADKMTFPSGALWHRDALYVASPPYIWKLEDKDEDGVAEIRTPLIGKFRSLGHAGDIHGPFLAPDGRLVITDAPLGHEIHDRKGNLVSKGTAARVFVCDTDGSNLETFCGGGTFNPVEVAFNSEGEMMGIMTWYNPDEARHDALVHYIYGGVYPKRVEAWINEFQRTGPLMPAINRYGVVAPSSIIRYRSDQLGEPFRDRFLISYFNTRTVNRISLKRSGATFTAEEEVFLKSSNPDFRPCDVIEDADGSLLVIDTGGWFFNGCPSSKIAKPEISGGIYRIRRKGAHHLNDPRGLAIKWATVDVVSLVALLVDQRPAVRERAVDMLAQRGNPAVDPIRAVIRDPASTPEHRTRAVFALSRLRTTASRSVIREALSDGDRAVRLAALRCVGRERDIEASAKVLKTLVAGGAAEKREAAAALGRMGAVEAVPTLLEELSRAGDRFLEHALTFALIEINAPVQTSAGLVAASSLTRRGALMALDQMHAQSLTPEQVAPLLVDSDAVLREVAVGVFSKHAEWSVQVVSALEKWCARIEAGAGVPEEMPPLLAAFIDQPPVQEALSKRPGNAVIDRLVLEAMAENRRMQLDAKLPKQLLQAALRGNLESHTITAIRVLGRHGPELFADDLRRLGNDPKQDRHVRLQVADALVKIDSPISDALHGFLIELASADTADKTQRLRTFRLLGSLSRTDSQRTRLGQLVAEAGPLELPSLLPALGGETDEAGGLTLVKSLAASAGIHALSVSDVNILLVGCPETVRKAAAPLIDDLERRSSKQAERLAELAPALEGGDPVAGREVFYSARSLCSICHRVGRFGGTLGPDLSTIGQVRSRRDLLEAIVFPSATFARGYEPVQIETSNGETFHGIIGEQKNDAVFLGLPDGSKREIARASITATSLSEVSPMPPGMDHVLTSEELKSLLAYLASLGGEEK